MHYPNFYQELFEIFNNDMPDIEYIGKGNIVLYYPVNKICQGFIKNS